MSALLRLRRLGERGLAACVRRVHALAERLRDLRDGVDTARIVEAEDVATTSRNKSRGIRYQPSPARPLARLLRALQLPPGQVFLDIGAGKGRVLMLAAHCGFARIVGIDYSDPLCAIARRNIARLRARHRSLATPIEVHCIDAADYRFADDETVIYLFNPFDAVVLARMLEHLAASLQRAPRRLWLIYHFPRWFEVIDACGLFERTGVHRDGGYEFAVYEHRPAG